MYDTNQSETQQQNKEAEPEEESIMWRCGVCKYIHEDDEPPEFCPKCEAEASKFSKMTADDVKKVNNADTTNELWMRIHGLLTEIREHAEDAEEEGLDIDCIELARRVQSDAYEMQQAIKAEVASHVNTGKWG